MNVVVFVVFISFVVCINCDYDIYLVQTGDCFQLYDQTEKVDGLDCRMSRLPEKQACVDFLPYEKECLGFVITATNETVELYCFKDRKRYQDKKEYFNVYNGNGIVEKVFPENFESGIGIKTPSNIIILFDSDSCETVINVEENENLFSSSFIGFSPLLELTGCYKIVASDQEIPTYTCSNPDVFQTCAYELPENKKCTAIRTHNNETLVLGCSDTNSGRPGCFELHNPDNSIQTVCQYEVKEMCMGVKTPSNLTVLLDCHSCFYEEFSKIYSAEIGDCYQLYDQTEKVDGLACRKSRFPEKQVCVDYLPYEKKCLGFVIAATNETVELYCFEDQDEKDYFNVYNINGIVEKVFPENLESGVGIKTPSNIIVLLHSDSCETVINVEEKEKHLNFLNNFLLDPESRSCYKIFASNQEISPYTCTNPDVFQTCAYELPENKKCTAIRTQNNETLVLGCSGTNPGRPGCFEVYNADNSMQTVCQYKVEERCMGVKTPSNLTVLLGCYSCFYEQYIQDRYKDQYQKKYRHFDQVRYEDQYQKKYRQFAKTYLENEFLGKNKYLDKISFDVYHHDTLDRLQFHSCLFSKPDSKSYTYWIPRTNCFGITLESNETIYLQCINEKPEKPGCYKIHLPDDKEETVCSQILTEQCVGLKTPKNIYVILECQPDCDVGGYSLPSYIADHREEFENFTKSHISMYQRGNFTFLNRNKLEVNKPGPDLNGVFSPQILLDTHWIPGERRCFGITTEIGETILLECLDGTPKKPGCFDVLGRKYGLNNEITGPGYEVNNVCIQSVSDRCVGVITPKNWKVLFQCLNGMIYLKTVIDPQLNNDDNKEPPRM